MDSPATRAPAAPCVAAGHALAAVLTADGELLTVPAIEAAGLIAGSLPILIHGPATFARLGLKPEIEALDLLELFAFVCPAQSATPTVGGLCLALGLEPPASGLEREAAALPDIARALLNRLAAGAELPAYRDAASLAAQMGAAGWPWAGAVLAALRATGTKPSGDAFRVWRRLPVWDATPARPPPKSHGVEPAEARRRLAKLLGEEAEQRPSQADYASAASSAFAPRDVPGLPQVVLAEAGTGTGKTLGYVAPASLWAERNDGAVWVSTYTKHLQRQVEAELARLEPDPMRRRQRFVVRKGRENYLCLLRLEEAVAMGSRGAVSVPLGLIARWALATEDGDIQGGDLPGWFAELFGSRFTIGLADRRGECLHGGCQHWRRCFVERTVRRARHAELVIANHALVLTQAALGGLDEAGVPTRYVFDEGHHLFDAADSAFSAALSGQETALLRHWLLGPENNRPGPRGLRARLIEVIADQGDLTAPLDAALTAARALAARDWPARLSEAAPELGGLEPGRSNPAEDFLRLLRRHVLARLADEAPGPGQHECDVFPLAEGIVEAADRLARALGRIAEPLATLRARLLARLEDEAADLTEEARGTIEGVARSIQRRALNPLAAWRAMLEALGSPPDPDERPESVTLVRLERRATGDHDVGLCRHWLDPTIPFALTLGASAHGMLVTSATLRDSGGADAEAAWEAAEARVGTPHLAAPAIRAAVASPFDYSAQTRVFVVTDVAPQVGAVAGAYRALFQASGGGGLGLFTAISRLRAVQERIVGPLEAAGIPLLAQHVDAMDNATLVDIFRSEEASCLLGTDAMRDGVDVPGRALRLVVFERVPWPRPDILHRERRLHLSGGDPGGYDCRIARLRLRQAFGRLIRRASDRGVFVLLDRQTPSRLLPAFPAPVRRVGLAEAVAQTASFLKP